MEDMMNFGDAVAPLPVPKEHLSPAADRARAAAAEAARQQRKMRVEALVAKRRSNFTYLKKMHQGRSFWLNAVAMTNDDINNYLASNDQAWNRLIPFFYLGLSMAKLLEGSVGMDAVRDTLQLFEEWEYHFSSFSVQSVKYVMAKNLPSAFPEPSDNSDTASSSHFTINKFNNEVIYTKLLCPHVSFELSYSGVVFALCDVIVKLYEKIYSTNSYSYMGAYDAVMKLDHKIKHFVISPITKDLTVDATQRVKTVLWGLRKYA